MKDRSSNGLRVVLVCVIAVGVAAVPATSASAALSVCIRNSDGSMREATRCKASEHTAELVTAAELAAQQTQIAALSGRVEALESLLAGVSRNADTLRLSGLDLQVVNGTGSTEEMNGLGNVIIGYNADPAATERTGSHNLVIGDEHSYTSHSGIASGLNNNLSEVRSFVSGTDNTASGNDSFVGGGTGNTASGSLSFVGGGDRNTASNEASFVGGGYVNTASNLGSFAGGGTGTTASGTFSFAGGGIRTTASGGRSFAAGGAGNTAGGAFSFVGGGTSNTASGVRSFLAGGEVNTASGWRSFVGGGYSNTASGGIPDVGPGNPGTTGGAFVGGGFENTASGEGSFVGGGDGNTASGVCAWLSDVNVVPC